MSIPHDVIVPLPDSKISRKKAWRDSRGVCFLVMFWFVVLFVLLRSTNFLAVDGNYRCLEVWHRQRVFFHGAGHMLYPVNVWFWSKLVSAPGFSLKTPFAFLAAVEVLNALAAAAALGFFFDLIHSITRSIRIATYGTILFGLSYAFIAQATNGNEPMVGVFWSFFAVWLTARAARKNSLGDLIGAGALFAVSLATYQSMASLALVGLTIIYFTRQKSRALYIGTFAASGTLFTIVIYAWIDWLRGIRSLSLMVRNFFGHEDAAGFFGITIGKVLSVPLGLANGFTPLTHYFQFTGLRNLTNGGVGYSLAFGVFPIVFAALLVAFLLVPLASWNLLTESERVGFVAALVGFSITLIPVISWDPVYDKLLILPVACLIFACSISFNLAIRQKNALAWLFVLPITVVLSSIPLLIQNHVRGTPGLAEVSRFAASIEARDLVVGDWDPASTLYSSIWAQQDTDPQHPYDSVWANNPQFFSFTTLANDYGIKALPRLLQSIQETDARGGKIYFVGLLDKTEREWETDLGRRFGMPFSAMSIYRQHSTPKTPIHLPSGDVFVRMYDPSGGRIPP